MTENKNKTLEERIASLSEEINDTARRSVRVIHEAEALKAARQSGSDLRHAYIAALESGIWPVRYLRNASSLSAEDQLKLGRSCVVVIGAGGLGANVLMLLARMGIGRLATVDPDVFEESNLNRQLTASAATLGTAKTEAARKMIGEVNPAVDVSTFKVKLSRGNAADILSGADVAIDALDSIEARMVLADACTMAGIPMVHAAIAGFEGQIMSIFPSDSGLEMIYGKGDDPHPGEKSPEAVLGVPGITPAFLAALEAMEAVKILLGRGRSLRNRMLYVDLENSNFQKFSFGTDGSENDHS